MILDARLLKKWPSWGFYKAFGD